RTSGTAAPPPPTPPAAPQAPPGAGSYPVVTAAPEHNRGAAPRPQPAPPPATPRPAADRGVSVFETFSWLLGWFFLPGLLLTLIFLLMPLIDRARVDNIKAASREGQVRLQRARLALDRKYDQRLEEIRTKKRDLDQRRAKVELRQKAAEQQAAEG